MFEEYAYKQKEKQKKNKMGRIKIYVLCHDDASQAKAMAYASKFEWMEPIRLPATNYMESAVFRLLREREAEWNHPEIECIGLLKYNFENKNPFYDLPALYNAERNRWDAWSFVNGHEAPEDWTHINMLAYATICHPLFTVIWHKLFEPYIATGKFTLNDVFSSAIPAFYSNAWMAKRDLFKSTVDWINHFMDAMDTRTDLQELLWHNSNYPHNMTMTAIQRAMKAPYYTYHCFITERLPCFFLWKLGGRLRQVGGKERRSANNPEYGLRLLSLV
jgi:hypothetical protein